MRRMLRWLWEYHGAPKLDGHIHKYPGLRPRNVTLTYDERETIFAAAEPHLRLWLLLCSDLALRSGTAAKVGPEHYDPQRQKLTFTTKYGARLSLPVTAEIAELIGQCDMRDSWSFVRQLWSVRLRNHGGPPLTSSQNNTCALRERFQKLLKDCGITRRIVPHDLRRTTAVAMLRHTGDVRDVQALLGHRSLQATIWYLDHDLQPVHAHTLEALKKPFLMQKEKTA